MTLRQELMSLGSKMLHVCFQIQPKGSLPLRHLLKRNTDNLYAELKYNETGIVQFH